MSGGSWVSPRSVSEVTAAGGTTWSAADGGVVSVSAALRAGDDVFVGHVPVQQQDLDQRASAVAVAVGLAGSGDETKIVDYVRQEFDGGTVSVDASKAAKVLAAIRGSGFCGWLARGGLTPRASGVLGGGMMRARWTAPATA